MSKALNSEQLKNQWKPLFELISAMTASEKGYFVKSAGGFTNHKPQTYVQLFHLIDKHGFESDAQLREKLGAAKTNIHSVRNYLYKQLLKSLRAFHSEKNTQFKIRELLDYAEILSEKGLLKQSQHFTDLGIELSDPVTLPAYQIIFQTHQIQLLRFYDEAEKIKKTDDIVLSITESADIIKHAYVTRQGLTKALFYVNTYFPLRNQLIKLEVYQLLNELTSLPDTEKQNYRFRNSRNAALSLLYRLLNDWDNALFYQEKTIRIFEEMQPQLLNRNIPAIGAYYNYISLFINKGDRNNYRRQLEKMRSLPVSGKAEEQYLKAVIYQLQLDDIIFNKDIAAGKNVVDEVNIFLQEKHPIVNIYHDTLIRLAAYFIYDKNYVDALGIINKLINSNFNHPLRSFAVHVKLLNILIHFELNNFLLLPGLIRSVYRFMMQQELKYEIEKAILNFFRRSFVVTNPAQLEKELEKLFQQLQDISNDAYEQQALLSFFDYRYWIAGKLMC
ncbi:MAG: hypothetical protein IPI65_23215 [Bacteroidetes bacterium]|nr:hypothetical protein [Bacteroidota bacterium]